MARSMFRRSVAKRWLGLKPRWLASLVAGSAIGSSFSVRVGAVSRQWRRAVGERACVDVKVA